MGHRGSTGGGFTRLGQGIADALQRKRDEKEEERKREEEKRQREAKAALAKRITTEGRDEDIVKNVLGGAIDLPEARAQKAARDANEKATKDQAAAINKRRTEIAEGERRIDINADASDIAGPFGDLPRRQRNLAAREVATASEPITAQDKLRKRLDDARGRVAQRRSRRALGQRAVDPVLGAAVEANVITAGQAPGVLPQKPQKPPKDPLKADRNFFEKERNRAKAQLRQAWRQETMQGLGVMELAAASGSTPDQAIENTSGLGARIETAVRQKERDYDFETQYKMLEQFPEGGDGTGQYDAAYDTLSKIKQQLEEELRELQREIGSL